MKYQDFAFFVIWMNFTLLRFGSAVDTIYESLGSISYLDETENENVTFSFFFSKQSSEFQIQKVIDECEARELGRLATISSKFEVDLVHQYLETNFNEVNKCFFFGLQAAANPFQALGEAWRFIYPMEHVDPTLTLFFRNEFQYPWATSQPNNVNGAQNCGATCLDINDLEFRWYNHTCFNQKLDHGFICSKRTLVVTDTKSPTPSPSCVTTFSESDQNRAVYMFGSAAMLSLAIVFVAWIVDKRYRRKWKSHKTPGAQWRTYGNFDTKGRTNDKPSESPLTYDSSQI